MKSLMVTTASIFLTTTVIFNVSTTHTQGHRLMGWIGVCTGLLAEETVLSFSRVLDEVQCFSRSPLPAGIRKLPAVPILMSE